MKKQMTDNQKQARLDAFNEAAHARYIAGTKKTFEELRDYTSWEKNSWSYGCNGDEWETIEDARLCGEEAADEVLEMDERTKRKGKR